MTRYTSEQVQEIVEEKDAEYKKLEEEYSYLKEEYGDLKSENYELQVRHERFKKEIATLKRKCGSYEKASQTVLSIYNEDLKRWMIFRN